MSKFSRQFLRVPRPQSLFGFISLRTGTELISFALVFNKVTGVYGLLAILTGYQLSLLQLSTYIYSIVVLVLLALLIPHIRKSSPFECLALAWVYAIDTAISGAYTAIFGLEWYFASQLEQNSESRPSSLPSLVVEGLEGLRRESQVHGKVVPQETATSMVLITALTLIRIYFAFVTMAYARQVLQKYIQLMMLEGPGVDNVEGPFAADLPDGEGRRGYLGRVMVSIGRDYWMESPEAVGWIDGMPSRKTHSAGTLAGHV